jgi:carbamoyl-phosphate synthase small subunit
MTKDPTFLVLEDGTVYAGNGFGADAPRVESLESLNADSVVPEKAAGEVVFNTAMSGYHEVLTDPSYTGQLVTMTYPHMGNYGDLPEWSETGPEGGTARAGIKPAGLIVRSVYSGPVPDGRGTLDEFLLANNTPAVAEIDTRDLTIRLRTNGSLVGILVRPDDPAHRELSEAERARTVEFLGSFPGMVGRNLIHDVGTGGIEVVNPDGVVHVALLDCGAKANILNELVAVGCKVTVFPSSADAEAIRSAKPQALLVSNGPGDPSVLSYQIRTIGELIGKMPTFGICLGHQLIALALGASTYKMKFGHHGVNHPVRDERTRKVFVTSQNHGFAVDEKTLPSGTDVWFRNANDGSIEGLVDESLPMMCTQFHPESAPGPHDSSWIFREFLNHI